MATNKNEAARRIGAALKGQGIPEQRPGEPRDPTPNAQVVLKRRYLAKDREGNVLEDTNGMFRRVARNLAQADLNYGADEQARQGTEDRFYAVMRSFDLLPNSPTLMNAGRELQQLSACFVLPVEDSLEDIFNGVKQTALIHKSGGGTGFAFSRLRPEGDTVGSTGGVASGPVSFIRAYDTATDVVKQGGTRRGANMGILDVTHPDILKFISAKESGDELQNFNISVAVSDDFMERVKASEDYDLVNPRTGETAKRLNAKEVFELIVDMAWKTGDPGLVFLDEVNRGNPNPQLGRIESTNPCVTGDTVVATSEGPRTVKSLIGREFKALVDGAEHRSTRQGFFPAGHKPVLRITLQAGQQLTLTGNHPVRRISDDREEWVRADLVKTGDALRIHDHSSVQARQASETFRRIGEHGATTALTTRTEVESNDGPHRAGRVVSIDDGQGLPTSTTRAFPGPMFSMPTGCTSIIAANSRCYPTSPATWPR